MAQQELDLTIDTLGEARQRSPLRLSTRADDQIADFRPADARILLDPTPGGNRELSFERAGPRQFNFFAGPDVKAGIVTCGGLCPGVNNVIREVVHTLWFHYGVRQIWGFRYGFQGLAADSPVPPAELDPTYVRDIHEQGGTVLGSSRGPQTAEQMVDTLERLGISAFFCIGGDGSMRGTRAIYEEIKRRGAKIAVVGVPKTIDNDLPYIERTFGFSTAVSIAREAVLAAHVEARGAPSGVGLVRLMGRHSGFIAAAATLATREVNLVLIPELPFDLDGNRGMLAWLKQRLTERDHAVIVVAEGAGQEHLQSADGHDASGNVKLGDIGVFLRDRIKRAFSGEGINLKYIDPSYMIRAAPASAEDAIFCGGLAQDAVHAAMAGKTGMVMGMWLNRFTHVPLHVVTGERKRISLDSAFWGSVVSSTGQPAILR